MRVVEIKIKNFQSVAETIALSNLGGLNILVGQNGSGKSTILRALSVAYGQELGRRQDWVRHGAGFAIVEVTVSPSLDEWEPHWRNGVPASPNSGASVIPLPALRNVLNDLENRLSFQWKIPKAATQDNSLDEIHWMGRQILPNQPTNSFEINGVKFSLGMYGLWLQRFWNSLRQAASWTYIPSFRSLQRVENPRLRQPSTSNGENLANTLLRMEKSAALDDRNKWKAIQQTVQQVIGRTINVTTKENDLQIILDDHNGTPWIPVVDSGSGLENFLGYLIHAVDRDAGIIGIEEPESHLHPRAQREMWRWLLQWSKEGHQLFVTTHSSVPDEILADPDVRVFSMVRNVKGQTEVHPRKIQGFDYGWPELGYAAGEWVGADGVLLVEGRSDIQVIGQWIRRLMPQKWYRVIPAEGKGKAIAAGVSTVLQQLGIPVGVLVDHNGRRPDGLSASPSAGVFTLERYEIENYLLDAYAMAKVSDGLLSADRIQDILQYEYNRQGPIAWAWDLLDTLPIPLSDSEKNLWVPALSQDISMDDLPLNKTKQQEIVEALVALVQARHPNLYRRTELVKVVRTHFEGSTEKFMKCWGRDPRIVVPGKETLANVQQAVAQNISRADYMGLLAGGVDIPNEVTKCIEWLSAPARDQR